MGRPPPPAGLLTNAPVPPALAQEQQGGQRDPPHKRRLIHQQQSDVLARFASLPPVKPPSTSCKSKAGAAACGSVCRHRLTFVRLSADPLLLCTRLAVATVRGDRRDHLPLGTGQRRDPAQSPNYQPLPKSYSLWKLLLAIPLLQRILHITILSANKSYLPAMLCTIFLCGFLLQTILVLLHKSCPQDVRPVSAGWSRPPCPPCPRAARSFGPDSPWAVGRAAQELKMLPFFCQSSGNDSVFTKPTQEATAVNML